MIELTTAMVGHVHDVREAAVHGDADPIGQQEQQRHDREGHQRQPPVQPEQDADDAGGEEEVGEAGAYGCAVVNDQGGAAHAGGEVGVGVIDAAIQDADDGPITRDRRLGIADIGCATVRTQHSFSTPRPSVVVAQGHPHPERVRTTSVEQAEAAILAALDVLAVLPRTAEPVGRPVLAAVVLGGEHDLDEATELLTAVLPDLDGTSAQELTHDFDAPFDDRVRMCHLAFRHLAGGAAVVDIEKRLPRVVFDYIDGGADAEITLRENARVFQDVASAV